MDPKKRILIVDDEPNVRLMLRTTLASVGYDVIEAADGQAALELLRGPDFECDMILLDLLMPRIDGMELLRRLRAQGSALPVVILTAHGSIPEAVEAMKLGAIDFLAKPTTPDALRGVVGEVIERHAAVPTPKGTHEPAKVQADLSQQLGFDLARAKRAINRGQFGEAETLLRELIALEPKSGLAHELYDRLQKLKEQEARGSFRILRDWFPSGNIGGKKRQRGPGQIP